VGEGFSIWQLFSSNWGVDAAACQRQDAKTSKSPHALVVVCPKKEFLFLFLPPLIFCFQKRKENHNVKGIKSL